MAAIVLVAGVGATLATAHQQRRSAADSASREFTATARAATDRVRLHLSRYEDLLIGYQALHGQHGSRRPFDFAHELSERADERHFAGLQGVVVAAARSGSAESWSSLHIEPHGRTAADLGLSVRNTRAVTEALRRSTDTGTPAVTAPLKLGDSNDPLNLAVWAPLYRDGTRPATVADRRLAVRGWVGIVFRADQFFNEALVRGTTGVGTEVFDGRPQADARIAARPRSFSSDDGAAHANAVMAPGRLWTLRMQPLSGSEPGRVLSTVLLAAGVLLSAMASVFIVSLGLARNRAQRLAAAKTTDLRRSEQRFRSLAAASPLGVFGLAGDGTCQYANERLCHLLGRTLDEVTGSGLQEAYHPDDRGALHKVVTGGSERASALRLRVILPDGSLRWVKTHAAPVRDDDGELTGWVGSVEDVTADVEAQLASQQLSLELAHQARHDHLTRLPNRTAFNEQVSDLLAETDGVSVLFFDIDRFKVVNDSLGHAAGDRLLTTVADRLRDAMRPGDIAARFGGDEFVVGLVGITTEEPAAAEAERLLKSLQGEVELDGQTVVVSVSMGVATCSDGADPQTLLTRADTAMYRAKAKGKARVEVYRDTVESEVEETTLELERQLREAIDHDELRVVYQPLVDVRSRAIVGVESLVRWQHPVHGSVSPASFIPLAEESGLVVPLGTWVLRAACAQLQRWTPILSDTARFTLTVNVSARQLADPDFPAVVAAAVADHDIDPSMLCLEITETALLQDPATAEEALRAVRAMGICIAVDDFGTGYSSLSHLKLLPIDMLKIDRSFIRDLGVDPDTNAIVGAVVRLAGALRLTSVAEGVESREQLEWLSSMGCDMAQGYFLATPEPAEVVARLLRVGTIADVTVGLDEPAVSPSGR